MKQLASLATFLIVLIPSAYAFESGSTGTDGALNPSSSTQLSLPPSGIFNFTDITIPAGVTVTFAKNATNTPVYILATGDVTIDGVINVNGQNGAPAGDGSSGAGGPGGFDGGQGGLRQGSGFRNGGNGLGPGGGNGAGNGRGGGAGGSFGTKGSNGNDATGGLAGSTYGSPNLRTLIGGSGGGGGAGESNIGNGGGGGGGAILIAASGTITVNGTITARGGSGSEVSWCCNGQGGSGSGGAIRLVATTIQGEGTITANRNITSIDGGDGRIRLEAENLLRTSATTPGYAFATPKPIFFSNFPSVRITTIGGETVPSSPTGFRDVVLAGATPNPVTVEFETTNVPPGTTISLTATPVRGLAATATSSGVTGSTTLGTASANINLPNGNSTLLGQASFSASVADNFDVTEFSKYAQGEKVETIRVSVNTNGLSETTFVTISGKEFTYPSNAIAMN